MPSKVKHLNKLIKFIIFAGLIFALSLGVDWGQEGYRSNFDITPYLNSPSDHPGSGPKRGPPYTPENY